MDDMTQIAELLKEVEKTIPSELQDALVWLVKNIEIVDELLKDSFMTEKMRRNCMSLSKERQEYILWILLFYQKFQQEQAGQPNLTIGDKPWIHSTFSP